MTKHWETIGDSEDVVVQADGRRRRVVDRKTSKVLFAYRIGGERRFSSVIHQLLGRPQPPVRLSDKKA